jgi:hypothetical protein
MERISRDTIVLFNELKKELADFELEQKEKLKFTYCEIGQLLTHAFSVSLTTLDKHFLRIKNWNTEFYKEGFELGFFNLDRIAITEKKIELTDSEFSKIQEIIEKDLSKIKINGITLDGLFCQLKIDNSLIQWNTNEEMNENLSELVFILRKKACVQHRV